MLLVISSLRNGEEEGKAWMDGWMDGGAHDEEEAYSKKDDEVASKKKTNSRLM